MERDTEENGYYSPRSSKSDSLTGSCVSAILAVVSLVSIPLIGFFVALLFLALAVGFWRRYLSGLSLVNNASEINGVA